MKSIIESIRKSRGFDGFPLWTVDALKLRSRISMEKFQRFIKDFTQMKHKTNYWIDKFWEFLSLEYNIAGLRDPEEAKNDAIRYLEKIGNRNIFVGITRPYGDDEPEPLEYQYIIGYDANGKIFVLERE